MTDVPLSKALLLYNSNFDRQKPAFAVRPLGHPDYYRYQFQVGACFADWPKDNPLGLKLRLLTDVWNAVAFYGVPVAMAHEALLVIPEYRKMLEDDCLPEHFRHERE